MDLRRTAILLVCVVLVYAEAPLQEEKCFNFYQEGEYEKAVDCLNSFLYITDIADTARLVSSYEHLGVCLTMLDKKGPARAAFNKLLDINSEHELDPNVYLPEIISLFQILKFERKTSLKVVILDTLPAYSSVYNFSPLGLPQFMNTHKIKGFTVLGLQVVTLALSIYGYQKEQSFFSEDYGFPEEHVAEAKQYDYMQKFTVLAFSVTYIYSLIDGFVNKRLTVKQ
jgi:tetratricopeptide (TPR) repeat protein